MSDPIHQVNYAVPKVIYDNDGVWESSGTADFFYYALASQGAIDLRGVITTCTTRHHEDLDWEWPFPPLADKGLVSERQTFIEKCRRSGLRNIPDCIAGPSLSLSMKEPDSGVIEDTEPIDNPGSRLIVEEANRCSTEEPLYLCLGGELTAVANAYLLDPSIADKVIILHTGGLRAGKDGHDISAKGCNFAFDGWAAYICTEKFEYYLMTVGKWEDSMDTSYNPDGCPVVDRERLYELPNTEIRRTMIEKWWDSRRTDWDSRPGIFLLRPDYARREALVRFSRWDVWDSYYPVLSKKGGYYKESPDGKLHHIMECDGEVATAEWWARAIDPAAWHGSAGQIPFGDSPAAVPGRIELAHFDHGGEGVAYHDQDINAPVARPSGWPNVYHNPIDPVWLNINCGVQQNSFRLMENVDLVCAPGTESHYAVGRTAPGEWIEYTVQVTENGTYGLHVAVASEGTGGIFHIEFDGEDKTGPLSVPDTGAVDKYQMVSKPGIELTAGTKVMKLCFDSAPNEYVGVFDHVKFTT
jgi:hypothetical protein